MSENPPPRPRQRGLFGPIDEPAPRAVAPATVAPAIAALAAQLPSALRLGTSSWAFAGWRDLVYHKATAVARLPKEGLDAYSRHPLLRAVGLDRTFYAPIDADAHRALADAVPTDFRFVVKAFCECTTPVRRGGSSNPHWLDATFAQEHVVQPAVTGLGARLGTVLFQFPPQGRGVVRQPERFAEHLGSFLRELPPGVQYHVELRDPELLVPAYTDALAATGVGHCYALHPRQPGLEFQRGIVPLRGPLLARWMLHQDFDYETAKARYEPFDRLVDPDPTSRRALADLVRSALAAMLPVTVVVNNKAEGSAPLSLVELATAILATTTAG